MRSPQKKREILNVVQELSLQCCGFDLFLFLLKKLISEQSVSTIDTLFLFVFFLVCF